jgi:hypothetical protein
MITVAVGRIAWVRKVRAVSGCQTMKVRLYREIQRGLADHRDRHVYAGEIALIDLLKKGEYQLEKNRKPPMGTGVSMSPLPGIPG